ncbi:metal ABC transporter solute-binding protein, Zn/Mn family [Arthrobacter sp. MA-N2]|uniref:metal ABC transporter solute-binding protein, Zn/Mn family n=1 Tax=Arthrobacter sp. MA-N2 TaxID=1101188 RepID=UPI0004892A17|nr:zinc ABC transporter substrate-binding protein [Arthrobacter sp. MA-N2]
MRHAAARFSLATVPSACAAVAVLLAGCAAPAGTAPSSPSGVIDVVASTSVYGDIAKSVGGDKVSVTSIISKTSQDPHSYEASTQDKLAISKAGLVIDNGAGYDDFFSKLSEDSKLSADKIITAVNVSGLLPTAGSGASAKVPEGFNEHVWYDFDAMGKVADTVAAKLGSLDSAEAKTFTANADKFKSSLTALKTKLAQIKSSKGSAPVAVTEPVPGYLLDAAGLENKTPEAFSHAIEVGSDVPPAAVKETSDLLTSKSVRFLAYNEQTSSPETEKLKAAAATAGVPVVAFTETLPEGKDYLAWMTDNVNNVAAALNK